MIFTTYLLGQAKIMRQNAQRKLLNQSKVAFTQDVLIVKSAGVYEMCLFSNIEICEDLKLSKMANIS